jgi:hypothetical protein
MVEAWTVQLGHAATTATPALGWGELSQPNHAAGPAEALPEATGAPSIDEAGDYSLRISPTTVDKLGVKLYDKVSAVVAELIANSYDADAENVTVNLPLGTELARRNKNSGETVEPDPPWTIEVIDDGHGMTPGEAKRFYLDVGRDRRKYPDQGPRSREKKRSVMGRKGIGKLAPFGVCRVIEVVSSGGEPSDAGYYTTHFMLAYDRIMEAGGSDGERESDRVPLDAGALDGTFRQERGTTIRLASFQPRRVPDHDTFKRQLERRFAVTDHDFEVTVHDARGDNDDFQVEAFQVPIVPDTKIDLSTRPVPLDDGTELPVTGQLGMATEAYRNEEMAGVRIYARGKIIATTRDFEQPAGYTGEYTTRSYLVGEVHADWLDSDDGDDLIRTDRQDILWSSELGEALRTWGADLIKEVGANSRGPRQAKTKAQFLERSDIERKARERFEDEEVVAAVLELADQIGRFAAEDELEDEVYVEGLSEVILSVAPHRALMVAFHQFSTEVFGEDIKLETLADIFGKTHVAEVASYAQIANERVRAITELEEAALGGNGAAEDRLQEILAKAPYLIDPAWSAVTKNQSLRTFKTVFEQDWKNKTGEAVELTIDYENKRPDFVLAYVGGHLHIVEIKAPGHAFANRDFDRLARYVRAFRDFAERHGEILSDFPHGWQIDLVTDAVNITDPDKQESFDSFKVRGEVVQITWGVFLNRARKAHEEFLNARERARTRT